MRITSNKGVSYFRRYDNLDDDDEDQYHEYDEGYGKWEVGHFAGKLRH